MVGTFYWHNQFAGFLLAPALIGLALLLARRAPWRGAGWVVAPLAVAGVVHSSSRGGMAVLLGGWLLIGVLAARVRADRGMLLRWLAASALAAGVTVAVSGPPFFASSASPFAAAQARAGAGETAESNGQFRLYMWRESVSVFEHDPLVGVGYGGFAPAAAKVTPQGWPRSPLAHNDYLQALAEGGLLLGVPFLGACALIGVGLMRIGYRRARRRVVDVRTGLVVASVAVMAHGAIDFDWSYPALLTLAAAVTAAAIAPALRRPDAALIGAGHQERGMFDRRSVGLRATVVGVLASTVIAGGVAGRAGGLHLSYHRAPEPTTSQVPGTAGR
jgi:O-antigen ligase